MPFILVSDASSLMGADARVLEVPADLHEKDVLLAWYSRALAIPEYWGANWDAFEECLRDLSWISERKLVLYHQQVPLDADLKDQKTYIEILADAARDWKPGEIHELIAAFDPACERKLRTLIHDRL